MKLPRLRSVSVFLLLCLACAGCAERTYVPNIPKADDPTGMTNGLGRAEPGYVQWLERRSLLARTGDLARLVAASPRQWVRPPLPPHPQELFRHADAWLAVHPLTVAVGPQETALARLADPALWGALQKARIRGLYVAPAGAPGEIWRLRGEAIGSGEDEVDFSFSEMLGSDDEYREMVRQANRYGAIAGMQVIAASSGIGPDFFLAARAFREYPGIYAMIEVPRDCWPLLPAAEREWEGAPLGEREIAALAREGIVAPALAQDGLGIPSGWAATHEVRGIDGTGRRFIYRWQPFPRQAAFNWTDPSRAAQRIASAAILRAIGDLGGALAGFRLTPLIGLAPADPSAAAASDDALFPAPQAALALGSEARQYGGWSMLADYLPPPLLGAFLAEGTDFALDSVTTPAAEHALLTGNARLLRASLDAAFRLGIDTRRLVHATPGIDGVPYAHLEAFGALHPLLSAEEKAAFSLRTAAEEIGQVKGAAALFRDGRLAATTPALAALAAGSGPLIQPDPKTVEAARRGHLAMIAFKAFQPGLLMLSAYDLMGALPPAWLEQGGEARKEGAETNAAEDSPRFGTVNVTGAADAPSVSSWGIPRAPALYAPLAEQAADGASLLSGVSAMLGERGRLEVAAGRLVARIKAVGSGVIVLATELPAGRGLLVSAVNFGARPASEHLNLARDLGAQGHAFSGRAAVDVFGTGRQSVQGGFLDVALEPWGFRAFVIE